MNEETRKKISRAMKKSYARRRSIKSDMKPKSKRFHPTKFNIPSNLLTEKERIEVKRKRILAARKGAKTRIKNKEFNKLYAPKIQKEYMTYFVDKETHDREIKQVHQTLENENEKKIWWFIGTIDEKISNFSNATGISRRTVTERLAEHISSM